MDQTRNMDTLTTELSSKLNPQWGPVRNIYTPAGGTLVKDPNELEPDKAYVIGKPANDFKC